MWAKIWYSKNFAAHSNQQNRLALEADGFHVAFFEVAVFYAGNKIGFAHSIRLQNTKLGETQKSYPANLDALKYKLDNDLLIKK